MVQKGEYQPAAILQKVEEIITREKSAHLEYASLCHPETLEEVAELSGPTLLALAVWVGEVRLIDNTILVPRVG
jgi:pantoate--beta-alanine ligase